MEMLFFWLFVYTCPLKHYQNIERGTFESIVDGF
jgi:hypothetical protein